MKKGVIIGCIISLIILVTTFLGLKYYKTKTFIEKLPKIIDHIDNRIKKNGLYNFNLPDYFKDFTYEGNSDEINKIYYSSISSYFDEDLIKFINNNLPKNLEEYQTKFSQSILELLKKEKNKDYSPIMLSEIPFSFSMSIMETMKYWAILSIEFQRKGDFKTSLLLPLGIYYFIDDLEKASINYTDIVANTRNSGSIELASKVILDWASHPHQDCQELSKSIGLDILKIVKLRKSFPKYIESYKHYIELLFKELMLETPLLGKNVFDSNDYKEMEELYINTTLKLESKPFFDVYNEFHEYSEKLRNFSNSYKQVMTTSNFIFNSEKTIIQYVFRKQFTIYNVAAFKRFYEESLGYMEFAAIALLINSYYCKNNKLPATIDELEKWSGAKLPLSRFENKPFVINLNDRGTLIIKILTKPNKYKYDYFNFQINSKKY